MLQIYRYLQKFSDTFLSYFYVFAIVIVLKIHLSKQNVSCMFQKSAR